jgi:hypothetical protein
LGIGDWGLGPIPNPQSPIPNPHSPIPKYKIIFNNLIILLNHEIILLFLTKDKNVYSKFRKIISNKLIN